MRNILLLFSMIMIFSCSKNEDVAPLDDKKEEHLYSHIEKAILNATSDTVGLKLWGMGEACIANDTLTGVAGCKNGKLWVGFFKNLHCSDNYNFEEKYTYTSKEDFQTEFEYDAGYGETDTVSIRTNDGLSYPIKCHGWSKDDFAIYIPMNTMHQISLIINDEKISYLPNLYIHRTWFHGYYIVGKNQFICNSLGELEFLINDGDCVDEMIPISLYEGIDIDMDIDGLIIKRYNIKDGKTIWSYKAEIGKTVIQNRPIVTHSQKIDGNYIIIDMKAVNFDGTKENKRVKLSLDDGIEVV